MEMKAIFAAQNYAQVRPALMPQPGARAEGAENGFATVAGSFIETLKNAEATSKSAMVGGADPHALVQALSSTQLAVETAVTVRDRVVEAYQEILRMPV